MALGPDAETPMRYLPHALKAFDVLVAALIFTALT